MFKVYDNSGTLDSTNTSLLQNYLNTTSSMQNSALVVGEWNLNIAQNINTIANYYNTPSSSAATNSISMTYNQYDDDAKLVTPTWVGATNAQILINGGVNPDTSQTPVANFFSQDLFKTKSLFSLEDCFGKFRPRSGINKSVYFPGRKINYGVGDPTQGTYATYLSGQYANRPRYYMPDANDQFKYWSSYRPTVVNNKTVEKGISQYTKRTIGGTDYGYVIEDAAPFVVYGDTMPTNRIVIKMQTNVGDVDFSGIWGSDPFYGYSNSTTPVSWRVDYLDVDNKTWKTAWNAPVGYRVPSNGTVELAYGLNVPDSYKSIFNYSGKYANTSNLPTKSVYGNAYLVEQTSDAGNFYIWTGTSTPISNVPLGYETFSAVYGWFVNNSSVNNQTAFITQVVGTTTTSPDPSGRISAFPQYSDSGNIVYREFQYVNGLRIVVDTMNKPDCSFDLIELSGRLAVNLTDKTSSVTLKKSASDLGQTGLPVGQLLVSTGSLSLFDYDKAFSDNNPYSLIAQFSLNSRFKPIRRMRIKPPKKSKSSSSYIQIKLYDVLQNAPYSGATLKSNYYVPVKTMYVDGFPEIGAPNRTVVITLRDFYFYLESLTAPQLFIPNCSLSFAITTLMDSIGFTNYTFKMAATDKDPVIPYFFIAPNTTVAQVLNDLAVSFQTAMFFDESNNLVIMYKNYLLPSSKDRATDLIIYGSDDSHTNGIVKNSTTYNITHVSNTSTTATYTYNGNFVSGQYVSITGLSFSELNLSNIEVNSVDAINKTFTVVVPTGTTLTTRNTDVVGKVSISPYLANIVDIKTEQDRVFNDGKISYTSRYIQKVQPTLKDQSLQNKDVIWKYKPVLLWEIAAPQNNQPTNESIQASAGYTLSALPLNTDLSDAVPTVVQTNPSDTSATYTTKIINNIIDFGENIQWISRYNGYFYANGEIIKYDAVQYAISGFGLQWITNSQDYQNYFAKLPFGGKIYPTGLIRVYSEPFYEGLINSDGSPIYDSNGIQQFRMKKGDVSKHGRAQFGTTKTIHYSGINSDWTDSSKLKGLLMDSSYIFNAKSAPSTTSFNVASGMDNSYNALAQKSTLSGIIKNNLSATNVTEKSSNNYNTTKIGSVQSSALTITGPKIPQSITGNAANFVSYIPKKLSQNFTHFGTRMRILGKLNYTLDKINNLNILSSQDPNGAIPYFSGLNAASGGIVIGLNTSTNFGYYFEITALGDQGVTYTHINSNGTVSVVPTTTTNVNNVFFYKVGHAQNASTKDAAIPQLLYTTLADIVVDSGDFVGQSRVFGQELISIYDLAIEYEILKNSANKSVGIKFYLYINDKLLTTVIDNNPLYDTNKNISFYNNIGLFVRGGAKIMFDNVYALDNNKEINSALEAPFASLTNLNNRKVNESFRKYSISTAIQTLYLSNLSTTDKPKHNIYFEEFGTIFREMEYINAKYDKAYPALIAKPAPTLNDVQGYVIAGFVANAYNAEFLVINITDSVVLLDDKTGNILSIIGITFTQESANQLTVDDFFDKQTNFADPQRNNGNQTDSPYALSATYTDIKNSRMTYGKNAFTLDAPYIQNQDSAYDMMNWITSKIMQPRFAVGLSIYGNPTVQLGDVVEIQYNTPNEIALNGTRFVVYSIQYDRDSAGPNMIVYLTEVTE